MKYIHETPSLWGRLHSREKKKKSILSSSSLSAALTAPISVKFGFEHFYENLSRNSECGSNRAKIVGKLTCRREWVLLLLATPNGHKSLSSKWHESVGLSEELKTLWEKATVLLYTFIAYISVSQPL